MRRGGSKRCVRVCERGGEGTCGACFCACVRAGMGLGCVIVVSSPLHPPAGRCLLLLGSQVYEALNVLGQTPWAINSDVFRVVETGAQLHCGALHCGAMRWSGGGAFWHLLAPR